MRVADFFRKKGEKVVLGDIHVSALPHEARAHTDNILIGGAEDLILEDMIGC